LAILPLGKLRRPSLGHLAGQSHSQHLVLGNQSGKDTHLHAPLFLGIPDANDVPVSAAGEMPLLLRPGHNEPSLLSRRIVVSKTPLSATQATQARTSHTGEGGLRQARVSGTHPAGEGLVVVQGAPGG
jgi:hypothetical protein